MDKRQTDLVAGIALAAFAVWYLVKAYSIRVFAAMSKNTVDSAMMPKIWAVCLLLLSAALILRFFRKGAKKAKAKAKEEGKRKSFLAANAEVIATFVSLFVYVLLLPYAGFIVSSMLYVFAQTVILMPKGERSYVKAGILAVVFPVAAYFLFVHLLAVLLPTGKWIEAIIY